MLTFVLGGARSGKSEWAEQRLTRAPEPWTYLATWVVADDAEMTERVATHRARRPAKWATVELAGRDLTAVVAELSGSVLVDSLGTWVAAAPDFEVEGAALAKALAAREGETIVVSEEVGLGVHPSTELGGRFRDALGTVNRQVAEVADRAVLVVAGRVLELGSAE